MRLIAAFLIGLSLSGCAVEAARLPVASPPDPSPQRATSTPTVAVFDLARLVAERGAIVLDTTDSDDLNGVLADLLIAARQGAEAKWAGRETHNRGTLRLALYGDLIGDGRTCALVQHEHRLADRFVRGSVRLCRAPETTWHLDTVVWRRSGGDLADLGMARMVT